MNAPTPAPTVTVTDAAYGRIADMNLGLDYLRLVHGEQWLMIHKLPPASGTVIGRTFIDGVVDKGADKGAVVVLRREVHDHESGEHLATVGQSLFARGDGGRTDDCATCSCDCHDHPRPAGTYLTIRLDDDAGGRGDDHR